VEKKERDFLREAIGKNEVYIGNTRRKKHPLPESI
jgi:hypothetical protein